MTESIFDGHRLGREIDQPRPEVHLPFERDTRFLDAIPAIQVTASR